MYGFVMDKNFKSTLTRKKKQKRLRVLVKKECSGKRKPMLAIISVSEKLSIGRLLLPLLLLTSPSSSGPHVAPSPAHVTVTHQTDKRPIPSQKPIPLLPCHQVQRIFYKPFLLDF